MSKNLKYSQYKQDKFVDIYFKKKDNGFFLDIGAYDGVSFSNSYFLEKERGWAGICIEPNPVVFVQLKINRLSQNYNVCISDTEGSVVFRKVVGYSEMLSGILEFMDQKHIDRINDECAKYNSNFEDIRVESKNLNAILKSNNIRHIDYLSIDTEGAESTIIKSIDLNEINIEFLTIENNDSSDELRFYLKDKGYKCIKSVTDDFFIKTSRSLLYFRLQVFLFVLAYTWRKKFPLISKTEKRIKSMIKKL
ncbi:methyltransferase FkbM family [Paludibacter propionicigenes WB4]|uniref:Methyltransferase FkbM family n=1 Tax=Paludibacter propionicigenes (strain DSM 17365 / JCM 13257 / WB4) TaxID=694427 RepID=E4T3J0_PALPW|nr:FkbM family methyltransferase [Paludibacter propionicigenes]ADQ79284.1 methyltransferase FkbM family [Paludibacter propionicigenes WB4]